MKVAASLFIFVALDVVNGESYKDEDIYAGPPPELDESSLYDDYLDLDDLDCISMELPEWPEASAQLPPNEHSWLKRSTEFGGHQFKHVALRSSIWHQIRELSDGTTGGKQPRRPHFFDEDYFLKRAEGLKDDEGVELVSKGIMCPPKNLVVDLMEARCPIGALTVAVLDLLCWLHPFMHGRRSAQPIKLAPSSYNLTISNLSRNKSSEARESWIQKLLQKSQRTDEDLVRIINALRDVASEQLGIMNTNKLSSDRGLFQMLNLTPETENVNMEQDRQLGIEIERAVKIIDHVGIIAISATGSVDSLISSKWRPVRLLGIAEAFLSGTSLEPMQTNLFARNLRVGFLTQNAWKYVHDSPDWDLAGLPGVREEAALRSWSLNGGNIKPYTILPEEYQRGGIMHVEAKRDIYVRLHWMSNVWLWGMITAMPTEHEWMMRVWHGMFTDGNVHFTDIMRSGILFFTTLTLSEVLNWRHFGWPRGLTYRDMLSAGRDSYEFTDREKMLLNEQENFGGNIKLNEHTSMNALVQKAHIQGVDKWLSNNEFTRGKDVVYLSQLFWGGSMEAYLTHFFEYQKRVGIKFSLMFWANDNTEQRAGAEAACKKYENDESMNVLCLEMRGIIRDYNVQDMCIKGKTETILLLLRLGVDVAWTDADIVFLRDPTEYMLSVTHGQAPINTQIGSWDVRRLGRNSTRYMDWLPEWRYNQRFDQYGNFLTSKEDRIKEAFAIEGKKLDVLVCEHWDTNTMNNGFFFIRASRRTMKWFMAYYRWLMYTPWAHDQSGFDAWLRTEDKFQICNPWGGRNDTDFVPEHAVSIGQLNLNEFPTSYGYSGPTKKGGWLPYLFHLTGPGARLGDKTRRMMYYFDTENKRKNVLPSQEEIIDFTQQELAQIKEGTDISGLPITGGVLTLLTESPLAGVFFDWSYVGVDLGFDRSAKSCRNFRKAKSHNFIPSTTRSIGVRSSATPTTDEAVALDIAMPTKIPTEKTVVDDTILATKITSFEFEFSGAARRMNLSTTYNLHDR